MKTFRKRPFEMLEVASPTEGISVLQYFEMQALGVYIGA